MAGEVQLKLQTTLDLAYLQTQLSSLSTLVSQVPFTVSPILDTSQLQKDLRSLNKEIRIQVNDQTIISATNNTKNLIRQLEAVTSAAQRASLASATSAGAIAPSRTFRKRLETVDPSEIKKLYRAAADAGIVAFDEQISKSKPKIVTALNQAGEDSIAGLLNGIKSKNAAVKTAARSLGDDLIQSLKAVLQIQSPSKKARDEIGKPVGQGIGEGVGDGLDKALPVSLADLRRYFQALKGEAQKGVTEISALMAAGMAGLVQIPGGRQQRARLQQTGASVNTAMTGAAVGNIRARQSAVRGQQTSASAVTPSFITALPLMLGMKPSELSARLSGLYGQSYRAPRVEGFARPRANYVNNLISYLSAARSPVGRTGGSISGLISPGRQLSAPGIASTGYIGRSALSPSLVNYPTGMPAAYGAGFAGGSSGRFAFNSGVGVGGGSFVPSIGNTVVTNAKAASGPLSSLASILTSLKQNAQNAASAIQSSLTPSFGQTRQYWTGIKRSVAMQNAAQGGGSFSSNFINARGGISYYSGGQFPMAGMMGPPSPTEQINAQTSMFGPSGPFGPGNRPPGGFYRGGGAPGGGGQVPSGGFPSAGPMGPQTQLGGGYLAVGQAINNFQKAYSGARQYLDKNRLPLGGAIAEIASEFGNAVKQVLLFGTAYKALAFFIDLPNQAFEAAKSLATYENQLKAVTSTTGTFEQSFSFVDGLAQRFNVPLESARQGFVKLYASMQPAGFDQTQIEGLFTGISKATVAFGLSADKVDRVNYAFAQMASKGQIMSEELKGQLGDVLPGALALFARAAQMSIPEFSKAMEDGAFKGKAMQQVLSNVGILMNREFGPAAQGAAKTLQGALTQMQNNLKLMYESMAPIVNAFAAAFGPQVNSLIKDVTSVMKVLTSTFVDGAKATESLSPRALALYSTIEKLRPSFVNAGAALSELGSRMASLAPVFVQVLKLTLDFIASPLGRAAIVATIAITSLNAALATLSAIGLTGAIKGIYSFIGGLLRIPQATGIARIAVIGLKLAITGIFVGAVLTGLDFVIGKIIEIGTAASQSKEKARALSQELDQIAGSADVGAASTQYKTAEDRLNLARKKNEKALKDVRKAREEVEGSRGLGVEGAFVLRAAQQRLQQAQNNADLAYEEVISAQKQLQQADKTRRNALERQRKQKEQTDSQLQKIDLQGAEGKGKKTSLEGYYSLEDQLAKNFTEEQIRRLEEEFRHKVELMNAYYDLQEARANSFQKDALRFEREMMQISAKRQEALLKASLDVMSARGSVAGPSAMGQATGGKSLGAGIAQYITGDPSSPFYRADHGGSNYHEHLAFVSRQAAEEAYRKLTSAGIQVTEFKGRSRVGRHTPGSAHYSGLAFDVPAAQVPVGRERELTARVQSILGIGGGGIGAGAPRKVTGNEKRDVIAQQKEQLAIAKQSVVARQAEELALKQSEIALRNYIAAILPTEEQALQNNLLSRRNDLIAAGTPEDVIERELKLFENQEKVRYGIEAVNRLRQQGVYTDKQAKAVIDELNNGLSLQNKLLRDNFMLQRAGKFNEAMRDLGQRRDILSAPLGQERFVELRQQGYSEEQAQQLFQVEELIGKMERLRGAVKGVADGINSSLGTALVDSVLKFDSLNEVASNFLNSVAGYFRDLANTIIQEMTRAFINKAVQSLLGNILNIALPGAGSLLTAGLSGGFSTASAFSMAPGAVPAAGGITMPSFTGGIAGGIKGFANGGMVTGPTLGLVGEGRYNEAIVPLPNGKSIPVELGGAAGNQIVSNITVNVSNGQTQSNATGANSSELGRKLEGAVKQVIIGELRPGGLLSR